MKAVVLREHGGIDKLRLEDLPTPEPGPGQILVRVQAVSLNHLDLWIRAGIPGLKLHYPHILGADISGVVDRLGAGVTEPAPGTPVIVNPGISCMRCRECLSGRDNLCREYGILGEHTGGGYCEYIAVPAANVVPRPTNLSPTESAAWPLTMLTAWQMLVKKARVLPGETVVVLAAGSGVGTAGVQIAKLLGARVIATATSDAKLERARALGADEAINTEKQDLVDAIKKLTDRRGADVFFEHVGKALWSKVILATCKGGRIVTCGATSGYDAMTDLRHIYFRQISILGSTMGAKGDMYDILPHIASGRLKPVVDRVLPLAEAGEAHRLLEDRAQFGKIVLHVSA
jgi:NADPH:quinone reductase-like Zn-dependent oxidoreductase